MDTEQPITPDDFPDPLAKSNRAIDYKCTVCGKSVERNDLTVKRVQFQTMGARWKTLRSRVVDWLCEDCRSIDSAWCKPRMKDSPGMADTKMAANG